MPNECPQPSSTRSRAVLGLTSRPASLCPKPSHATASEPERYLCCSGRRWHRPAHRRPRRGRHGGHPTTARVGQLQPRQCEAASGPGPPGAPGVDLGDRADRIRRCGSVRRAASTRSAGTCQMSPWSTATRRARRQSPPRSSNRSPATRASSRQHGWLPPQACGIVAGGVDRRPDGRAPASSIWPRCCCTQPSAQPA